MDTFALYFCSLCIQRENNQKNKKVVINNINQGRIYVLYRPMVTESHNI
jgi:hypothetical protein